MPNLAMLSCWNHYHAVSFVRDLTQFPEAKLVAVWDSDEQRGRHYADEFGTRYEPDLDCLLAAEEIDGVIIDAAPEEAALFIELAAKAGKHVLCDQILALTRRDANRVSATIEHSNIHFAIDMSLRRWPVNIAAKKAATSGAIGNLTTIRIRNAHHGATGEIPLDQRYLSTEYGVFTDLGAHCLYLMNWILGRPVAVTAIMTHYTGNKAEDIAAALFEFANGAIAVCDTSYAANLSPFSIELYGTAGSFLGEGADGVHRKLLRSSDSRARIFAADSNENNLGDLAAMGEAGESTLSLWLKAIEGQASLPPVSEGIVLAETLEAMYLSAQTGNKVYLDSLKS